MIIAISFNDHPDAIVSLADIGAYWRSLPDNMLIENICYSPHQSIEQVDCFGDVEGIRSESNCAGYVILRKKVIPNIGSSARNLIGLGWSTDGENVCINWYDEATGEGVEKERRSVNACGIGWRRNIRI